MCYIRITYVVVRIHTNGKRVNRWKLLYFGKPTVLLTQYAHTSSSPPPHPHISYMLVQTEEQGCDIKMWKVVPANRIVLKLLIYSSESGHQPFHRSHPHTFYIRPPPAPLPKCCHHLRCRRHHHHRIQAPPFNRRSEKILYNTYIWFGDTMVYDIIKYFCKTIGIWWENGCESI